MSVADRLQHIARTTGLKVADVEYGNMTSRRLYSFTSDDSADSSAMPQPRRYLIASITKPIVAMAALKLAGEGHFSLVDRIGRLLPEFRKAAYRRIAVRHLLTHTSGFPDMLPDNAALRATHTALPGFLACATEVEPDFPAGSDCRYSSVGFLILGALIQKITGTSLSQFLHTAFFEPLQMQETWLGIPTDKADNLLPTVQPSILPEWQPDADDWGWNSRYWRTLGAPWGGMISTASDLGRFAGMMLADGFSSAGHSVLPTAVVRAAMSDQIGAFAAEPGFSGAARAWGFGWRRQWPAHQASFGDFLSADAVGHWGATGTTVWIDPAAERYAVILTTTPYEESQSAIQQMSNVIAVRNVEK